MKIYAVEWVIPQGGRYIPPDPCVGGDYYEDRTGVEVVTASTATRASAAVKALRPAARVRRPRVIVEEA